MKHYSIHTERSYCDWIKRYINFHNIRSKDELNNGEAKIEQFLILRLQLRTLHLTTGGS
ncbi:MAG: phage integrase N-terminal SAM-like domain-containing protein [Thermodesulfobacteriota bacterium]|nr:phage integrase N-terminal SAM-like domain-containing protein [Thermodesulfobacteriota bacterium]